MKMKRRNPWWYVIRSSWTKIALHSTPSNKANMDGTITRGRDQAYTRTGKIETIFPFCLFQFQCLWIRKLGRHSSRIVFGLELHFPEGPEKQPCFQPLTSKSRTNLIREKKIWIQILFLFFFGKNILLCCNLLILLLAYQPNQAKKVKKRYRREKRRQRMKKYITLISHDNRNYRDNQDEMKRKLRFIINKMRNKPLPILSAALINPSCLYKGCNFLFFPINKT